MADCCACLLDAIFRSKVKKDSQRKCNIVVALDINGTILEGDSYGNGEKDEELDSSALTAPASNLLKSIEQRKLHIGIVVYTFGFDWPPVLDILQKNHGRIIPVENRFFIARAKESSEIWVFPLRDDSRQSKFLDFTPEKRFRAGQNQSGEAIVPAIRNSAQTEVAMTVSTDLNSLIDADVDAYRFRDVMHFRMFVGVILGRGDVLFRAAYDPQNSYFHSRKTGKGKSPGKILASARPLIAFDDHPDDWELSSASATRVVNVVSPRAAFRKADCCATNFENEFNDFLGTMHMR